MSRGAYTLIVSAIGQTVERRSVVRTDGQLVFDVVLRRQQPGSPTTPYSQRQIYYATDRSEIEAGGRIDYADKSPVLGNPRAVLGLCAVSVQRDDALESTFPVNTYRPVQRQSERGQAIVDAVAPATDSAFYAALTNEAQHSRGRAVTIFVHGYNQSFDDAVRAAAQLQYEMSLTGPIVAYSWPSEHSLFEYEHDEDHIAHATRNFETFIQTLQSHTRNRGIALVLIAHSMGNRIVVSTLQDERGIATAAVLAAPDVSPENFAIDDIRRGAPQITMYASKTDQTLLASLIVHHEYRIGIFDRIPFIATGMDTIDATRADTSLLGHSYFVDSAVVAHDIADFIASVPAVKRSHLAELQGSHNVPYWEMDP